MRKGAKLILVTCLIAAGGLLAFAGAAPAAYHAVGDVAADPAGFEGREIEIKSSVRAGSVNDTAEPVRFTIADERGALVVEWDPARPMPEHEAAQDLGGRTVVVTGELEARDGSWVFRAHDMHVGCQSKYEPAE